MVIITKPTLEKVRKFVKENLVSANNTKIHCMDGRFTPEQSEGAVRAPGGDLGMVMAFAGALKDEAVSMEPDEIVDRYYKAVSVKRGLGGKLYYHSDSHSHEHGGIGCGHVAKAASPENDGLYGSLTHQEVRSLYESFKNHPNSELTVLDGSHEEQAVIFVESETNDSPIRFSVNSMDDKGNMHFVVDLSRAYRFIEKAAPYFSEGLQTPVKVEDVKRNFLQQLESTASILASKLDKYKVVINPSGEFSVVQLSHQAELQN